MKQLNLDDFNKIIVLAPHPDDEVLGCFSLFQNPEWLKKLHIVYLTDGCFYDYPNIKSQEARDIRKKELQELCSYFKVTYTYAGIKDTHLSKNFSQFKKIIKDIYQDFKLHQVKTAWFVPNKHEKHEDHKSLHSWMEHMLTKLNFCSKQRLIEYEVWTPITSPKYYYSINPIKKEKAIQFYFSQIEKVDYIGGILGLNKYRGLQQISKDYMETFK